MKLIEADKVEQAIKDYWKAQVDRLPRPKSIEEHDAYVNRLDTCLEHNSELLKEIEALPSAQPEIIRCGQCKYAEVADSEDSQDGYTCQFHRGSIWFSGSYCSWAERRMNETD